MFKKKWFILAFIALLFWQSNTSFSFAQGPRPPFALDGKPVYVFSGQWREARLSGYTWDSRTGFLYSAVYAHNDRTEEGVTSQRILSAADARRQGIATNAHDVSSQAGVNHILNAHNTLRKRYGLPALTWSPKLASYAQQWANTLLHKNGFQHRPNAPYGENLAEASGQQLTPEQVVNMWGSESRYYDHAGNSCAPGNVCGHFTQIVWKDTKDVGCGMARNDRREVWVCNYNPPGNVIGRKPY